MRESCGERSEIPSEIPRLNFLNSEKPLKKLALATRISIGKFSHRNSATYFFVDSNSRLRPVNDSRSCSRSARCWLRQIVCYHSGNTYLYALVSEQIRHRWVTEEPSAMFLAGGGQRSCVAVSQDVDWVLALKIFRIASANAFQCSYFQNSWKENFLEIWCWWLWRNFYVTKADFIHEHWNYAPNRTRLNIFWIVLFILGKCLKSVLDFFSERRLCFWRKFPPRSREPRHRPQIHHRQCSPKEILKLNKNLCSTDNEVCNFLLKPLQKVKNIPRTRIILMFIADHLKLRREILETKRLHSIDTEFQNICFVVSCYKLEGSHVFTVW